MVFIGGFPACFVQQISRPEDHGREFVASLVVYSGVTALKFALREKHLLPVIDELIMHVYEPLILSAFG